MTDQLPDPISDSSESLANDLARKMMILLGSWDIPTNPLPDYDFKAGRTMAKPIKKIIRVPIDPPVMTKIIKKVKIVRQVKPEQLTTDGRPSWVKDEPIFCVFCKCAVVSQPNGDCPSCHNRLFYSDIVPF